MHFKIYKINPGVGTMIKSLGYKLNCKISNKNSRLFLNHAPSASLCFRPAILLTICLVPHLRSMFAEESQYSLHYSTKNNRISAIFQCFTFKFYFERNMKKDKVTEKTKPKPQLCVEGKQPNSSCTHLCQK